MLSVQRDIIIRFSPGETECCALGIIYIFTFPACLELEVLGPLSLVELVSSLHLNYVRPETSDFRTISQIKENKCNLINFKPVRLQVGNVDLVDISVLVQAVGPVAVADLNSLGLKKIKF